MPQPSRSSCRSSTSQCPTVLHLVRVLSDSFIDVPAKKNLTDTYYKSIGTELWKLNLLRLYHIDGRGWLYRHKPPTPAKHVQSACLAMHKTR